MRIPLFRGVAGAVPLGVLILGVAAQALSQNQAANSAYAPQTTTLHVTGTASRFTISANKADVKTVLKLVFDQAGKDFTLDGSVTGDTTLRLTEQPFLAAIKAICDESFLRYTVDRTTGAYRFQLDIDAIKVAFSRMRAVDQMLRVVKERSAQDESIEISRNALRLDTASPQDRTSAAAKKDGPLAAKTPGVRSDNLAVGGLRSVPNGVYGGGSAAMKRSDTEMRPLRGNTAVPAAPQSAISRSRQPSAGTPVETDAARQLLEQNGLVSLDIQEDSPLPVAEALKLLARQANAAMVIDNSVPTGRKFRIHGHLAGKTLADALNLLASTAHLEWQWINNVIFVTTAPEFSIYYGDSDVPRTQFGNVYRRGGRSQSPAGNPAEAGRSPAPEEKSSAGKQTPSGAKGKP